MKRNILTTLMINISFLVLCMLAAPFSSNAQPRWQWIMPITGQSFDEGFDMGIAPNGDLHMVGDFSDSLHVDSNRISGIGNYDGFSLRLSAKGKVLDYDAYGGVVEDEVRSLAVDNKGNYYITGAFEDIALVGGEQIESIEPFTIDMFLAKFDKTGILQWVKVYGSPDFDEAAPNVGVDSLGNVYLAGGFGKTATFGTKTLTSTGDNDMFVAKISALGEVIWAKRAGSTKSDVATDVAVSPNGDRVYVVGTFSGSVNFGGLTSLESYSGEQDMVVWTLSADGAFQWTSRIGYQGKDNTIRCFADETGRLLVTGGMMQTTTFGEGQSLVANGEFQPDIFVARYTKSGTIDLLKRYGGTFKDVAHGIVSNSRGAIYITGEFDSTTTIGTTVLMSHGGMDMFMARLWPNGDGEWAVGVGGAFDDIGRAVAVSTDGVPYVCGSFDTEAWFGGRLIKGERFTDAFVGALECGPNTELTPHVTEVSMCAGSDTLIYAPNGYTAYQWFVDGKDVTVPQKGRINLNILTEGVHQVAVRIVDDYGCVGISDTITVTVRPGLPEPIITKVGNVLSCSVADVSYQWYYEGNPIQGGINQTQELVGQGLYKVLVYDTSGCSRFSANYIEGTTGVAGDEASQTMAVWPNPFTDVLQLYGVAGSSITISDMLGNQIVTMAAKDNVEHLPLHVAAGTYVLVARKGNDVHTVLITKQ